jgi:hypothetical protein
MNAIEPVINESYLWTNSSIVLTWIQGLPTRWKRFVGNRVALIQEKTSSEIWRHVPTLSNPADLISRGMQPTMLSSSSLWWHGPPWLSLQTSNWPTTEFNSPTANLKFRHVHVAVLQPPDDITSRYSKLSKLLRVIAYCKKFTYNCRHPTADRLSATISAQDLDQARICCVKLVQQACFAQEIKDLNDHKEVASNSPLKTLYPFIDQEGLVKGWRTSTKILTSLPNKASVDTPFESSFY